MRTIKYPDDMESKFKFVTIAALRCQQLQKGAKPRIQSRSKKFTTIAQEEVLEGRVDHTVGPPPEEGLEILESAGAEETSTEA